MDQDREHLHLLSIFHYVVGGMAALFACVPLVHFFLGLALTSGVLGGTREVAEVLVGWVVMAIAGALILTGWTFAALLVLAGRFLARRIHYTFCLVMGGVACLFMPFGTVLGVFSIVVLTRPSVKRLFAGPGAAGEGTVET